MWLLNVVLQVPSISEPASEYAVMTHDARNGTKGCSLLSSEFPSNFVFLYMRCFLSINLVLQLLHPEEFPS